MVGLGSDCASAAVRHTARRPSSVLAPRAPGEHAGSPPPLPPFSPSSRSVFEAELADHIPVIKTSIAGTRLVGSMTVGNRNGLLVPSATTDQGASQRGPWKGLRRGGWRRGAGEADESGQGWRRGGAGNGRGGAGGGSMCGERRGGEETKRKSERRVGGAVSGFDPCGRSRERIQPSWVDLILTVLFDLHALYDVLAMPLASGVCLCVTFPRPHCFSLTFFLFSLSFSFSFSLFCLCRVAAHS